MMVIYKDILFYWWSWCNNLCYTAQIIFISIDFISSY